MGEFRDRKIKSIYDAIENGQHNQAMRLCDKKEICDLDIVRALRSVALARQGYRGEALSLCREVMATQPKEEDVISALSTSLKSCNSYNDLLVLYQNYAKYHINDLTINKEIFNCAVILNNYLLAQQTALKLLNMEERYVESMKNNSLEKIYLKGKFLFCAAACMVVQYNRQNKADRNGSMVLSLASKLMQKAIEKRKTDAEKCGKEAFFTSKEVSLYCSVLLEEKREEEAIAFIAKMSTDKKESYVNEVLNENGPMKNGPAADMSLVGNGLLVGLSREEKVRLETQIFRKLGRTADARKATMGLLDENPDQWNSLLTFIGLSDELIDKGENVEDIMNENWEKFEELIANNLKFRGPRLAQLETIHRFGMKFGFKSRDIPVKKLEKYKMDSVQTVLYEMVRSYFQLFCTKQCCFEDLKPYLNCLRDFEPFSVLLESVSKENLVSEIVDAGTYENRKMSLRKFTCANQILFFLEKLNQNCSVAQQKERIKQMVQQYCNTLDIKIEDGERTFQEGDELLVLILLRVLSLSEKVKENAEDFFILLVEAIGLVEFGISRSMYNYQLKILAVEAYDKIGCFSRGFSHFKDLNVKQIQAESLSYLSIPSCVRSGLFNEAQNQCRSLVNMHRNCNRDTSEYIGQALLIGNYTKALEICEFQDLRMEKSLQLAFCKASMTHFELLLKRQSLDQVKSYITALNAGILPESTDLDESKIEELTDNIDRTALPESCYRLNPEKMSPNRVKLNQQLRAKILVNKIVFSAVLGNVDDLSVAIENLRNFEENKDDLEEEVIEVDEEQLILEAKAIQSEEERLSSMDVKLYAIEHKLDFERNKLKFDRNQKKMEKFEENLSKLKEEKERFGKEKLMLTKTKSKHEMDTEALKLYRQKSEEKLKVEPEPKKEDSKVLLLLNCASALKDILEAQKNAKNDSHDLPTKSLKKATESVESIREEIVLGSDAHVYNTNIPSAVPLRVEWIKEISGLVSLFGTSISYIILALSRALAGELKKVKKPKGAKKKASKHHHDHQNPSKNEISKVFDSFMNSVTKLLKAIADIMRKEMLSKDPEYGAVSLEWFDSRKSSLSFIPLLQSIEGFDMKNAPLMIMQGQGQSSSKIMKLAKDINSALLNDRK